MKDITILIGRDTVRQITNLLKQETNVWWSYQLMKYENPRLWYIRTYYGGNNNSMFVKIFYYHKNAEIVVNSTAKRRVRDKRKIINLSNPDYINEAAKATMESMIESIEIWLEFRGTFSTSGYTSWSGSYDLYENYKKLKEQYDRIF